MPDGRGVAQLPPATLAASWDGGHVVLAHCDGSISTLRDGKVVSVILTGERVTVLHATNSHIFAGFEHGSLRKFDVWTGLCDGQAQVGFEPSGLVVSEKEVVVWGISSRLVILRRATLDVSHFIEAERAVVMATGENILLEDGVVVNHKLQVMGDLGCRDNEWIVDAAALSGDTWFGVWRDRWSLLVGFDEEFGAVGPAPFNKLHAVGKHLFLECDDGVLVHVHQNHVQVMQCPPEHIISFIDCSDAGVLAITQELAAFAVDKDRFIAKGTFYPVDTEPSLVVHFNDFYGYPDGTVREIREGEVVKEWSKILPSSVVALSEAEACSIDTKVTLTDDPPTYTQTSCGRFREYYRGRNDNDKFITYQNTILPREPTEFTAPLLFTELRPDLDHDEAAREIAATSSAPLYEDYAIMRPSERAAGILVRLWGWSTGRLEALLSSGGFRSFLAISVAYPKVNVADWLKSRISEYLEGDMDEKIVAMRVLGRHPTLAEFPFAAVASIKRDSISRKQFILSYARGNPEGLLSQSTEMLPNSLQPLLELVQDSAVLDSYCLDLVKLSVSALPSMLSREMLVALVHKLPEEIWFHREEQRIVARGPGTDATLFNLRQASTWTLHNAGLAVSIEFVPAGDALRGVVGGALFEWRFPGALASIFNRQANVIHPQEVSPQ